MQDKNILFVSTLHSLLLLFWAALNQTTGRLRIDHRLAPGQRQQGSWGHLNIYTQGKFMWLETVTVNLPHFL